jgi:WD40 repeat protein
MMQRCPTREQLERLLARQATGAEQAALERHVEQCAACQRTLEELTAGGQVEAWRRLHATPTAAEPELDAGFLQQVKQQQPARDRGPEADTPEGLSAEGRPSPTLLMRPDAAAEVPVVAGFEIEALLGRGGMGVVYRARQQGLNRLVALKMILAGRLASAADVRRFRHEAEAAALMDHPGIVPIYEVGEWQPPGSDRAMPYFSMKLIEGGSLAACRSHFTAEPRAAVVLMAKVARAVHYAHQRGILHRDLKPGNILLDDHGEPLVTDFGLAKRLDDAAPLTQSESVLGTPGYMAPEQTLGRQAVLTTAADVHSLGAILYELLTGRPPFRADNVLDTLLQLRQDKPVSPRTLNRRVDADLETVCLKCLEKEPARRYASAAALADDLERWLAGEVIQARRSSSWLRLLKWARRRPALAGMGALLLLTGVLALVGVGALLQLRQTEQERDRAAAARDLAEQAQQQALQQRQRAEAAEELAQHHLYANRVQRAHFEWLGGDLDRAEQVLEECPVALRQWEWHYVKRLCHAELVTCRGHSGAANGVCFGPGGDYLASGGADGTVRLWEARTGRQVCCLRGGPWPVRGVCFSPGGDCVASATEYATVQVWDVKAQPADGGERTRPRFTLRAHTRPVLCVCFSPDGKRLASGSQDRTIKVWDARTGKLLLDLKRHAGAVNSVCFSPDGRRLASASWDETVRLWDAHSGREIPFREGLGGMFSVCFSPDGKRLATAGVDKAVTLWDVEQTQVPAVARLTLQGHPGYVNAVCFSPDGKRLASADGQKMVKVWDAQTGREVNSLLAHNTAVAGVCFSPDGKRLASASWDGTVKVWDAERHQEGFSLRGQGEGVEDITWGLGGRFAAAGADGGVRVWDLADGANPPGPRLVLRGHRGKVRSVCFSPDGKLLASAGEDRVVKVWDVEKEREVLSLAGHAGAVWSVCFSADGKLLASAGEKPGQAKPAGDVRVWEVATSTEGRQAGGRQLLSLLGPLPAILCVCFSPEAAAGARGRLLAGAGKDGSVRLWEVGAEQAVVRLSLRGHDGAVERVCFSPDGRRLASAGHDGTVKLWDAAGGEELRTLKGPPTPVNGVCFSPDGRRLASAGLFAREGQDCLIKVWDVQTGEEVLALKGSRFWVNGVCFSPDGRRLASTSRDQPVKIWEATPLAPAATDHRAGAGGK